MRVNLYEDTDNRAMYNTNVFFMFTSYSNDFKYTIINLVQVLTHNGTYNSEANERYYFIRNQIALMHFKKSTRFALRDPQTHREMPSVQH